MRTTRKTGRGPLAAGPENDPRRAPRVLASRDGEWLKVVRLSIAPVRNEGEEDLRRAGLSDAEIGEAAEKILARLASVFPRRGDTPEGLLQIVEIALEKHPDFEVVRNPGDLVHVLYVEALYGQKLLLGREFPPVLLGGRGHGEAAPLPERPPIEGFRLITETATVIGRARRPIRSPAWDLSCERLERQIPTPLGHTDRPTMGFGHPNRPPVIISAVEFHLDCRI